ncbi:Ras-related protein Rab-24 [Papilio xuthus]|uniref:Ras-related protein Rab-24 n=1 Tax=Papilio xuthus TaxID=66420 RepID=A0A194Q4D6_PAPXU|nr:Ras-related protein Rab-24 [Papilio xuthus]
MSRCDFKIVLLGSEHVGKTSLVLRFVNCRFNASTPYQNTIGAAFCAKAMYSNGKTFNVGIWDTAGSERYEAMTKMYYRGAHAAIICYDPSSYASWIRLRHWLQELRTVEEVKENIVMLHISEKVKCEVLHWTSIHNHIVSLRDCKVYLCATKKDLLDSLAVEREVPEDIVTTYSQGLSGHFITSSKTGENVEELFQKIVDDCAEDRQVMKNVEEMRMQLAKEEADRLITLATKPRSVNLALETTFEFNNKQDVSIIQKVRNFLNKIENVVDKKLAKRNGETTEFTDFLQDLISTINTYEDDDFKQKKREKTIKEKYNDYKVKEFSPVSNDGSNSSSSLEYDWQTRPTRKRKVTPQWHTIPRPLKVRVTRNNPFGIYNNAYKFQLPQMLRRTELDEKDSNKTNNETCPKEIITANYLSKIKNLEDELQRVREQLKAKITTLKKDNHGTDDKEIDKDNELYFRVSDLSSPVTLKRDLTKRPKMMEYKLIELKNKTEDNTTKYSEEFSHESREMSFDVPYNMTYRSTNQSIYISNQTSMEIFSPETTFKYNITTIKPIINIPKVTNTTYLNEIENTTKLIKENNTVSQEISN